MPDESDYKNYKSIEDYGKTIDGSKYFHSLYLKAVNHPIRREILRIVNENVTISKKELLEILKKEEILSDENIFTYNIDFLKRAFCIETEEKEGSVYYKITQEGKVIEYF
ncbi:MAG: hypothetical protein P8Y70_17270 [Candidatus Lokiarchaeota archaeon]